jgi:4-hydroxy-tetrahydrodipicolinate synthase
MISPLPHGIVPVLQTPFDAEGAIDYPSLARLIDDAIAAGAAGFLSPAVASEVSVLTGAERSELLHFVVDRTAKRVPLIVGCSSPAPSECARLASAAASSGAAAVLVAIPDSMRGSPEQLIEFFRRATDSTDMPLIVQDLDWTGPGLPPASLEQLRRAIPQLAGCKIESVPAGPKYTEVRLLRGADFHISGGWATPQMIEAMDRGVDALIPEASMVRIYSAIWRLHHSGERAAAVNLFRRFIPVLTFTNQEIRLSIAFCKRLLVRKGIFTGADMRVTGFDWDTHNLRIADELIQYSLDLESSLGS